MGKINLQDFLSSTALLFVLLASPVFAQNATTFDPAILTQPPGSGTSGGSSSAPVQSNGMTALEQFEAEGAAKQCMSGGNGGPCNTPDETAQQQKDDPLKHEDFKCQGKNVVFGGVGRGCTCSNGRTYPNCDPANESETQEDPKAQCRARTLALADQCDSSSRGATSSCDGNQLNSAQQRFQQEQSQLQGQEKTNAVCQQQQASQSAYANQVSQFAGRCQNAITQCSNACQQMLQSAQSCQDEQASRRAQASAPSYQTCTSTDPDGLPSRPGKARQEADYARSVASDGGACATNSSASTKPGQGDLNGENQDTSGTAPPGRFENPQDGGGQNTGNGGGSGMPSPALGGGSFSDTAHAGTNSDPSFPGFGQTSSTSAGGYSAGSSLASLPQTPQHAAEESDESDPERKRSGDAFAGTYGGGGKGGRRMGLRPLRGLSGQAGSEADTVSAAAAKSSDEYPDLSQFRPKMLGMARCPAGTFANPENPKECFHSGNRNIFDAMTQAIERDRSALPRRWIEEE